MIWKTLPSHTVPNSLLKIFNYPCILSNLLTPFLNNSNVAINKTTKAIKMISEQYNVSRSELYQYYHELKER